MSVFDINLNSEDYLVDILFTAVKYGDFDFACSLLEKNLNLATDKSVLLSVLVKILKPHIIKPPLSSNVLLNKIADLEILNGTQSNEIFNNIIFRDESLSKSGDDDYNSDDIDFVVNELGLKLDLSKLEGGSYGRGSRLSIIGSINHCLRNKKISAANFIIEELRLSGVTFGGLSSYELVHSYLSNYLGHTGNRGKLMSVKDFYLFLKNNNDVICFCDVPEDDNSAKNILTLFSRVFSKEAKSTQSLFSGGCLSENAVLGHLLKSNKSEGVDSLLKIIKLIFNKEMLTRIQMKDGVSSDYYSSDVFFSMFDFCSLQLDGELNIENYIKELSREGILRFPMDGKINEKTFLTMFYVIGSDKLNLLDDCFGLDLNKEYNFNINEKEVYGTLPYLFFEYINSITRKNIESSYSIEKVFDFTHDLKNISEQDVTSISSCLQRMIDNGFDVKLKNNKTKKTNLKSFSFGDNLKKWASKESHTADSFKKFCNSVLNELDNNSLKGEICKAKEDKVISFKI